MVFQCVLAMKEQFVHVPEPALERSGLGRGSSCHRVRMDLREWKMPEGEADTFAQLPLDPLDLPKRLLLVRAFVIAVLDDETTGRRAADVIDFLVERVQGRRRLVPASRGGSYQNRGPWLTFFPIRRVAGRYSVRQKG